MKNVWTDYIVFENFVSPGPSIRSKLLMKNKRSLNTASRNTETDPGFNKKRHAKMLKWVNNKCKTTRLESLSEVA